MIKTSTILVLRTPSHEGAGSSIKWTTPLLRAMSGIELSRVRTELRLLPHEPINQSLLVSRAGIVMQSSEIPGEGSSISLKPELKFLWNWQSKLQTSCCGCYPARHKTNIQSPHCDSDLDGRTAFLGRDRALQTTARAKDGAN